MQKIPLSPIEKEKLRKGMLENGGACLFVMFLVSIIYVLLMIKNKIDFENFWIFHVIVWLVYAFFTYLIWSSWKDYDLDYKWQMSGKITEKKIKHSGSSSSTIGGTYAGGRLSSSSSSSSSGMTTYRFKIDGKWHTVTPNVYHKYQENDIFHCYLTGYNHYFLDEIISINGNKQ